MASTETGDRSARRWPLWVAVGAVAVLAIVAVVTVIGAARANQAADDAEAEVAAARQANEETAAEIRQVRADTRDVRQQVRVLRGLFVPGMAETLRAAYVLVAAEVCASDHPEDPDVLARAARRAQNQLPALRGHHGWEAVLVPERVADACGSGG